MKKLLFVLLLSLFSLGLNASESGLNNQDGVSLCSDEEELKKGDYVVRPEPCPVCNCYGWIVDEVFHDKTCRFICVRCGESDLG